MKNIAVFSIFVAMAWAGGTDQSVSAQGLLDRLRTRIDLRRQSMTPPPVVPQRPLSQNGLPDSNELPGRPQAAARPNGPAVPWQGRFAAKPPISAPVLPERAPGRLRPDDSTKPEGLIDPTIAKPRSSLGIEARNATPRRGVIVVIANESMAGVIGGLKPQDRIVSVEGRLVRDINDLMREFSLIRPGQSVGFGVVRGDALLELPIEMGGPGGQPIRAASNPQANNPSIVAGTDSPSKAAPKPSSQFNDAVAAPDAKQGSGFLGGMGSVIGDFFATPPAKTQVDPLALPEDPTTNLPPNPPPTSIEILPAPK